MNVIADLVTPRAERPTLGDNYRVEARVIVWESPQVLKVPVSALFRRGGDWAVYAVRDGRATTADGCLLSTGNPPCATADRSSRP